MSSALWYLTKGKWAAAFPDFILSGAGIDEQDVIGSMDEPEGGKSVAVCIPGEDADNYQFLYELAEAYERVVFVIFADERGLFEAWRLDHPNQVVWSFAPQYPIRQGIDRVAPFGWTTGAPELIAHAQNRRRFIDWSFLGQVTHSRRLQCVAAAKPIPNGVLYESRAFSMGVAREEYFQTMVNSKFVLCPGGPCTADSFRFAEALEAGAIPIADDFPGEWHWPEGYWETVCGKNLPFPVVRDWSTLPSILREWNEDYELKRERCARWWRAYKQGLIDVMREDLSTC